MTRVIRLLHLEDNPGDAEIIHRKLEAEGVRCDIVLVRDKGSFETALAGEPFDLILADYSLPDYDGVAALKQAKAVQPDVPVILVSGTVGDEQAVRCLHMGATDYLLKDRLERLGPAVERALQEAETRRTRRRADLALIESETRKTAILNSVLDCIITMDANGIVIEFNAAAERTFGYTKAEAIGRSLADLIIPPRFRDQHSAGIARYVATGTGSIIGKLIEMTAIRSDGTELPVELAITAIGSGTASIFTGVLRDITARNHAEAALARLAAIVDSSDDAIFSVAMDGTVLTCNAAAERLYGYPASEIVGRHRNMFVPEARREELVPVMARAARGELGESFDTKRVRKDGSIVDIALMTSPMPDATGKIASVSIIARDITSRRKAEADARAERDRAQRYLDAAEVILLDLDLDGRIVLVNRYACALLGWPCEELVGRDWIDTCLPARVRAGVRVKFQEVLNGNLPILVDPVVTRAGEERWIEWRNQLLRDGDGHVVGTFSCGIDVTERDRAAEALGKAEERMRFALESANVGIWDADYATGAVQCSEILETQCGLAPGTFGGTLEAFVECIHPDDRQSVLATIGQAMVSGTDFTMVHRSIRPDGSVRWLNGAGRVKLGVNGKPVRGIGISMDVTERHTLELQYQQAQKMEAIGQLAGGVAHDFNNLLTVILGNCELLQDPLDPDTRRQEDLGEIQKAGLSAASLTRQLLAFSRKEIIETALLDLNVVVGGMRPMLRRLIREDIEIVMTLRRAMAPVRADRGQVEQIVMNLAVNARDAMPHGGTLTIEIGNAELDEQYAKTHTTVTPGPYVVLTMTDTGSGMTPEVQRRLFEPFFTTKNVGRGTGLGLASVHGIVTQSNGSIDVSSTLGVGTAFTVYFPRVDDAELAVDVPLAGLRRSPVTATILIVEDAEGLRLLTTKLLQRHGYTVLVAENAEEAVRVFDANPAIDLVLTDVVMPGGSGPALARQLIERRQDLKVIYMSGYTDEAIVHHGVLEPGIAFLHKPFTSEALSDKIREALDR